MGNFSISHYSGIRVEGDAIDLRYILDMAEIPTFQEIMEMDTDGDKKASSQESQAYLSRKVEELKGGLTLKLNGEALDLVGESSAIDFPPGAGGLPTLKIYVDYRARMDPVRLSGSDRVFYQDHNFSGRAGWKEIIVTGGNGIWIQNASVPSTDRSAELSSYPADPLLSPPQDLEATFSFSSATPQVGISSTEPGRVTRDLQPSDSQAKRFANRFTELVSPQHLTLEIILISLIAAFGLGAFHALSPGHGKTVVAAYLVGSRGTARHAVFLGTVVTLTHTVGVFILGLITLYASKYIVPEKLYPWLGFFSGLTIVGIGLTLFIKRYRGLYGLREVHGHSHFHAHGHAHAPAHGHSHFHAHGHIHAPAHGHEPSHSHLHHAPPPKEDISLGSLLALGVSGGIVPCPSALVVLLSAISLHRIGFGLVLIVAFSVGLALVLMSIGLLMVYAKQFMDRFRGDGAVIQRLPLLSSALITLLGVGIAVQSLVSGGVIQFNPLL